MTKILVIDDSMLSRAMVVSPLEESGYEIIQAADGELGLAAYHQHHPDCVTTDLLMPVLDGFGFLKRLRAEGIEVPVIVVSADIQTSSRDISEQYNIQDFLNKPVNVNALLEAVQTALLKTEEVH